MARHRELRGDGLHLMRHLGREGNTTIDVAPQSDGDQIVRVRGKVFALDLLAVAQITVLDDAAVEAEAAVVVAHGSQSEVFDMQRAEGLEELRVRPLHMQLQRVGLGKVLLKQRLADLRNPLMGVLVELSVHRLARPQGDIVQIDDVIICAAIHKGAYLTIADGQRLLEEVGRRIIPQHHRSLSTRGLSLVCGACEAHRDCPQCAHRQHHYKFLHIYAKSLLAK